MSDEHSEPATGASCCPLPPGVAPLPLPRQKTDDDALRLAAVAKALSDPIRLRMLALMVEAAGCCRPTVTGKRRAPTPEGVCVCEFQDLYGLAQSKVSYHLRVLREAGLVREHRRGKWSFYSVDPESARGLVTALQERLGV